MVNFSLAYSGLFTEFFFQSYFRQDGLCYNVDMVIILSY